LNRVLDVSKYLIAARPTAVNLAWAVRRVSAVAVGISSDGVASAWSAMLREAHEIAREDAAECRKIGEVGAELVRDGMGILTHCNAGALATVAYGTALAPLYVAQERGVRFRVFADETRPLLQGARLTALELSAAGIDVTVLCDNAAGALMAGGQVQLVIVGADRIAANGDTANKIGTYGLAVLARRHGVPFYVAAPRSTFDLSTQGGSAIPIEERSAAEVRKGVYGESDPIGIRFWNPAFDVTPAELITGFVTPKGRLEPVSEQNIADFFGDGGCKVGQSC
jgi:methylthioribose-1-phosphate isomerase